MLIDVAHYYQVGQKTYRCKVSEVKFMARNMPPPDIIGSTVFVKYVEGIDKPWVEGKVVGVTTQDRCSCSHVTVAVNGVVVANGVM